jgi:hypothetical protein
MNEETQKDVLADVQAKSDGLPACTVLEPPDNDVQDVEFGDPKLMMLERELVVGLGMGDDGEGYCIASLDEMEENDYLLICVRCPLCGDDGSIYGNNRWWTQACCYLHNDAGKEVERWIVVHLSAGESVDEVHAKLTEHRTCPTLRTYVERIYCILHDDRTAADYKKYLGLELKHQPHVDYCPNCAVFYDSIAEPEVPGTCGCCGAEREVK